MDTCTLRASLALMTCFVAVACAAGHLAANRSSPCSYVAFEDHPSIGGQPCPLAVGSCSKRGVTSIAKDSDTVAYGLTNGTNAATLLAASNMSRPASPNYVLTAAKTVRAPAVHEITGLACLSCDNQCLISGQAGICYQLPQILWCNTGCCATHKCATFSPALPRAVRPLSSQSSTHLTPQSASSSPARTCPLAPADDSASSTINTFRPVVMSSSVASYQGAAATNATYASVSVLWRTSAYAKSTMPDEVHQLVDDSGISKTNNAGGGQEAVRNNITSGRSPGVMFGWLQCTRCAPDSRAKSITVSKTCPAAGQPIEAVIDGRSGHGSEADWVSNDGRTAVGTSRQVSRVCGLGKQEAGFCCQQPQKNTNCRANLVPYSGVVLRPARQCAVRCLSSLSLAPLTPLSARIVHNLLDNASPKTNTLRPVVTSSSVASYQGAAATSVSFASSSVSRAYCQSTMPDHMYQVCNNSGMSLRPSATAAHLATSMQSDINIPEDCHQARKPFRPKCPWPQSCHFSNPSTYGTEFPSSAASLLLVYPGIIGCIVKSGEVAKIPEASGHQLQVAICSYVHSSEVHRSCLRLAELWWLGQNVQFDPGGPCCGYGKSCIACHERQTLHVS